VAVAEVSVSIEMVVVAKVEVPVKEIVLVAYKFPTVSAEVEAGNVALNPSDEVATQRVLVPVERSICPWTPEALLESRSAPEIVSAVMVALLITKLVELPVSAVKTFAKSVVEVAFVVEAFVAKRLVVVLLVITDVDAVSDVIVVVASVEVPTTVRVPCEVSDEVAVISPPVSVLIVPVIALRVLVKKSVEVALVNVAFVAVRVEMIAVAALKRVAKRLEDDALTRFVEVAKILEDVAPEVNILVK
jgi:hypothetical protein